MEATHWGGGIVCLARWLGGRYYRNGSSLVSRADCFEDRGLRRRYWGVDVHCLCVRYVPTVEIPRVEEVWKVGKGEEEKKRRTRKSSTTTRDVLIVLHEYQALLYAMYKNPNLGSCAERF